MSTELTYGKLRQYAASSPQLKKAVVWLQKDAFDPHVHHAHEKVPWYLQLWIVAVDYFSTMGYQPFLAMLSTAFLAPVATLLLVLVTLCCAVPLYALVVKYSPHGEGSIGMIEQLLKRSKLPSWYRVLNSLLLLAFAFTDFIITITLSDADAAIHLIENPLWSGMWHAVGSTGAVGSFFESVFMSQVWLTDILMLVLCAVFTLGLKEAVGVAVLTAVPYTAMCFTINLAAAWKMYHQPELFFAWLYKIQHFNVAELNAALARLNPGNEEHVLIQLVSGGGLLALLLVNAIRFPRLALGMSGFETGAGATVGVEGYPDDDIHHPTGQIRNTRKMMMAAAIIMGVNLLMSSVSTTVLIPEEAWIGPHQLVQNGTPVFDKAGHAVMVEAGEAYGRGMAFLAHALLGSVFGSFFDAWQTGILWFAGASAMLGLLILIPRYLPRYGMGPHWFVYRRPLIFVITAVCLAVSHIFHADVEKQGGAYATGVLALMTSAAGAVLVWVWIEGRGQTGVVKSLIRAGLTAILITFAYVFIMNLVERPDGIKIATVFAFALLVEAGFIRFRRASELRVGKITFDETAMQVIESARSERGNVRVISRRPVNGKKKNNNNGTSYQEKFMAILERHNLLGKPVAFLEVQPSQVAEFLDEELVVQGRFITMPPCLGCPEQQYGVLFTSAHAVPNAIAAISFELQRMAESNKPHGQKVANAHVNFEWGFQVNNMKHPLWHVFSHPFSGQGAIALFTSYIVAKHREPGKIGPVIHTA